MNERSGKRTGSILKGIVTTTVPSLPLTLPFGLTDPSPGSMASVTPVPAGLSTRTVKTRALDVELAHCSCCYVTRIGAELDCRDFPEPALYTLWFNGKIRCASLQTAMLPETALQSGPCPARDIKTHH
jgi:hypothetical protein